MEGEEVRRMSKKKKDKGVWVKVDEGPTCEMKKLKVELPPAAYDRLLEYANEKGWDLDFTVRNCIDEHIIHEQLVKTGWIRIIKVEEHRSGGL
jgi:hypothetical protein